MRADRAREMQGEMDAGPKLPLYPNGDRQKQGKLLNWGGKKRKNSGAVLEGEAAGSCL